ncbi:hypothetical protein OAT16_00975 [Prolixibacteraceae bacterium]|nr:hypothetical protein [Prolixibacteraceae bacterium]
MKNHLSANVCTKRTSRAVISIVIGYALIYSISPTITNITGGNILIKIILIVLGLWAFFTTFLTILTLPYYLKTDILQGVIIDDEPLKFHGKVSSYVGILTGYTFLSIISYNALLPLYLKKTCGYIIDNITYRGKSFRFRGSAKRLAKYYIPGFILFLGFFFLYSIYLNSSNEVKLVPDFSTLLVIYLLSLTLTGAFIALVMHWYANVEYQGYNIQLTSGTSGYILPWIAVIAASTITFGIGLPFMTIWIWDKYTHDLEATRETEVIKFSTSFDLQSDGLFMLGQILLTICTLYIYLPFAIKKVSNRMIPKIAYERF